VIFVAFVLLFSNTISPLDTCEIPNPRHLVAIGGSVPYGTIPYTNR
jgi:hypothetical protein